MNDEGNENVLPSENQDSLEWGSIAKDCKAKLYVNMKKMSDAEINELIVKANRARAKTANEAEQE